MKNFDFSEENIYIISKLCENKEKKISPSFFSKICGTTGLVIFLIRDALEYTGIIIDKKTLPSRLQKLYKYGLEKKQYLLEKFKSLIKTKCKDGNLAEHHISIKNNPSSPIIKVPESINIDLKKLPYMETKIPSNNIQSDTLPLSIKESKVHITKSEILPLSKKDVNSPKTKSNIDSISLKSDIECLKNSIILNPLPLKQEEVLFRENIGKVELTLSFLNEENKISNENSIKKCEEINNPTINRGNQIILEESIKYKETFEIDEELEGGKNKTIINILENEINIAIPNANIFTKKQISDISNDSLNIKIFENSINLLDDKNNYTLDSNKEEKTHLLSILNKNNQQQTCINISRNVNLQENHSEKNLIKLSSNLNQTNSSYKKQSSNSSNLSNSNCQVNDTMNIQIKLSPKVNQSNLSHQKQSSGSSNTSNNQLQANTTVNNQITSSPKETNSPYKKQSSNPSNSNLLINNTVIDQIKLSTSLDQTNLFNQMQSSSLIDSKEQVINNISEQIKLSPKVNKTYLSNQTQSSKSIYFNLKDNTTSNIQINYSPRVFEEINKISTDCDNKIDEIINVIESNKNEILNISNNNLIEHTQNIYNISDIIYQDANLQNSIIVYKLLI